MYLTKSLAGFIKSFNFGQQQRLHKSTFSAETELAEDSVGPGYIL